ncbi:hypothetical protein ACFQZC_10980 [Streptacidiphilus monticola]
MTTTPTWDPFDRVHPVNPPGGTSSAAAEQAAAAVPTPVFVDHSGRRGRRLRGLGWLVGSVSVGFAVAMTAGLIGTQSQAPPMQVPANVDTTPPGQFLDAPVPTSPRRRRPDGPTPAREPAPSPAPPPPRAPPAPPAPPHTTEHQSTGSPCPATAATGSPSCVRAASPRRRCASSCRSPF